MNRPTGANGEDPRLQVRGLWKVFGQDAKKIVESEALQTKSKTEILEEAGHVVAVRNASFEVCGGETFVVMGLSGCGKSTLVRCLIRLVEPTRGAILVDGQDITTYSHKELLQLRRHKAAMVFQQFGLLPHRTVIDNVTYGLEVRGADRIARYSEAEEVLSRVGLKGWERAYPDELSGGMQQRVGLARALAMEPDILLMDEPFSGLDPLIRRDMQDELLTLQEELRKTIVFITHDLDEALKMGDRIAIMRDGEIIQTGTPEQIVASPADTYVEEFTRGISKTRVMSARTIMLEPAAVILSWQGPQIALRALRLGRTEFGYVVDSRRRLKGMLTPSVASHLYNKGAQTLQDAALEQCPSISADTPIDDVLPLAAAHECPIAVLDDQERLIGVIERAALLGSLAEAAETRAVTSNHEQGEARVPSLSKSNGRPREEA